MTVYAPSGGVSLISAMAARFVPWASTSGSFSGGMYPNPLTTANRTGGNVLNQLILHLVYTGPTPITIDAFEVVVTTLGAAGSVVRPGIYQVVNQSNPFIASAASTWATLLFDAGTIDTTANGARSLILGTPFTVAP